MKPFSYAFFLILTFLTIEGYAQVETMDSGGPLMPEQAAYDATFYDINLTINPQDSTIQGFVTTEAEIVHPTYWFVLDLDSILAVESVAELQEGDMMIPRDFHRKGGKLWIDLKETRMPGERVSITVSYGGRPVIAARPPWDGGFTWKYTIDGAPWIATTCQTNGADIWWPNKDHVSDKPDSVGIHITVPKGLVVATNGREMGHTDMGDQVTWHWFVSTPISNYNIALNIAPYKRIDGELASVSGDTFPVTFWVLPQDYERGEAFFPEIIEHLTFFEKLLGPYPFQQDKYGAVQTPHLGMEHQTIIAYGANFSNTSMTGGRDWGFDALHQHELAHEWWGNLVTNSDWRDMWIHEGFGSYMQALYVQYLHGEKAYRDYMRNSRFFANTRAVAPRQVMSATEIYRAPIYTKGSWTLHNLRYLIGDKAFFQSLREMCYPDWKKGDKLKGTEAHFVTTDDFVNICEKNAGVELDWFFDVYLRQPKLPKLISRVEKDVLTLRWESPDDLPFYMPVEVKIGDEVKRYDIPKGGIAIPLQKGDKPEVDPERWVLMEVSRA